MGESGSSSASRSGGCQCGAVRFADLVPTTRLGTEAQLAWTNRLAVLPALTTEAWLAATPGSRERHRSRQHPDHDT